MGIALTPDFQDLRHEGECRAGSCDHAHNDGLPAWHVLFLGCHLRADERNGAPAFEWLRSHARGQHTDTTLCGCLGPTRTRQRASAGPVPATSELCNVQE